MESHPLGVAPPMPDSDATIIPIASGKGGVGKTFLTANLAVALAEKGRRTIVVDLDLGGSNLHTFLELPNQYPGIGDFLKARRCNLEDLLVPTQISGLSFLPGDGKTPLMANIPFAQKTRLISWIRKLPAEYILLDLGAGTSFNTLDYFGISPRGIVVVTPEYTSVMGMLAFLKNYLLRAIERKMAKNRPIRLLLHEIYQQPKEKQVPSIQELHRIISEEDEEAGREVAEVYSRCRPRVVFNMATDPSELKMATNITHALGQILSMETDFFGFVFGDPAVRQSIRRRKLFLPNNRQSMAADNIVRIAHRIVKYWDRPVKNSAERLQNYVRDVFENKGPSCGSNTVIGKGGG